MDYSNEKEGVIHQPLSESVSEPVKNEYDMDKNIKTKIDLDIGSMILEAVGNEGEEKLDVCNSDSLSNKLPHLDNSWKPNVCTTQSEKRVSLSVIESTVRKILLASDDLTFREVRQQCEGEIGCNLGKVRGAFKNFVNLVYSDLRKSKINEDVTIDNDNKISEISCLQQHLENGSVGSVHKPINISNKEVKTRSNNNAFKKSSIIREIHRFIKTHTNTRMQHSKCNSASQQKIRNENINEGIMITTENQVNNDENAEITSQKPYASNAGRTDEFVDVNQVIDLSLCENDITSCKSYHKYDNIMTLNPIKKMNESQTYESHITPSIEPSWSASSVDVIKELKHSEHEKTNESLNNMRQPSNSIDDTSGEKLDERLGYGESDILQSCIVGEIEDEKIITNDCIANDRDYMSPDEDDSLAMPVHQQISSSRQLPPRSARATAAGAISNMQYMSDSELQFSMTKPVRNREVMNETLADGTKKTCYYAVSRDSWCALFVSPNGVRRTRTFSCNKWGYESARIAASAANLDETNDTPEVKPTKKKHISYSVDKQENVVKESLSELKVDISQIQGKKNKGSNSSMSGKSQKRRAKTSFSSENNSEQLLFGDLTDHTRKKTKLPGTIKSGHGASKKRRKMTDYEGKCEKHCGWLMDESFFYQNEDPYKYLPADFSNYDDTICFGNSKKWQPNDMYFLNALNSSCGESCTNGCDSSYAVVVDGTLMHESKVLDVKRANQTRHREAIYNLPRSFKSALLLSRPLPYLIEDMGNIQLRMTDLEVEQSPQHIPAIVSRNLIPECDDSDHFEETSSDKFCVNYPNINRFEDDSLHYDEYSQSRTIISNLDVYFNLQMRLKKLETVSCGSSADLFSHYLGNLDDPSPEVVSYLGSNSMWQIIKDILFPHFQPYSTADPNQNLRRIASLEDSMVIERILRRLARDELACVRNSARKVANLDGEYTLQKCDVCKPVSKLKCFTRVMHQQNINGDTRQREDTTLGYSNMTTENDLLKNSCSSDIDLSSYENKVEVIINRDSIFEYKCSNFEFKRCDAFCFLSWILEGKDTNEHM